MAIILVGILIIGYRSMFMKEDESIPSALNILENANASQRVADMLASIEKINFDKNAISDPKFSSLKDFSLPLPSLPIGKKNPFSYFGSSGSTGSSGSAGSTGASGKFLK